MTLGVLDAAQLVIIHHVARNADGEQVSDACREDGLGDDARIGAGKHDGERMLAFFGC